MASLSLAFTISCAFSAALAARLSFIHRADRAACELCVFIAVCLLIAALGFLLMHRASLARFNDGGAARLMPAAPVSFRAPSSLAAPARVSLHGSLDLPARYDP